MRFQFKTDPETFNARVSNHHFHFSQTETLITMKTFMLANTYPFQFIAANKVPKMTLARLQQTVQYFFNMLSGHSFHVILIGKQCQ
jgi:hypothetical protein